MLAVFRKNLAKLLGFVVPVVVFLGFGALLFPSSGRDDVHIVYWSVYALSHLGDIVNYNGENLEQHSSLAHVLFLALLTKLLPVTIATVGPLFSVALGAISLVTAILIARSLGTHHPLLVGVIIATAYPFLYWAFSGLETSFAAFSYLWFFYAVLTVLTKPAWSLAKALGVVWASLLVQLVRPEAFFVVVAALLATLVLSLLYTFARWEPDRSADTAGVHRSLALLILLELVIAGAIAGARYVYFGNFVPQPVSAKVGGVYPSGSLASSLLYVAEYGYANQLSVILVVAGTLALGYDVLRRKRALDLPGVVLLALLVAQLAFMLSVGGDWMEGHRFFAPLVPLAVIFLVYWMSQYMTRQVVVLVFAVLTVFQAATTVKFAQVSSTSMPIWKALALDAGAVHAMATEYSWFDRANRVHLRDIPFVERMKDVIEKLHNGLGRKITIMSQQAGFVMFNLSKEYFREVRFIDVMGLADDTVSACPEIRENARRLAKSAYSTTGEIGNFILTNIDRLNEECGVPEPDVIFMLDNYAAYIERYEKQGYRLVFWIKGEVKSHSKLAGAPVSAGQWLMVREDLVPLLGSVTVPEIVVWPS